ncbi:MAG: polyprenol monophosphomannose synthase [Deltaproteobacteria bacterium]|nr:MAG: polyprenol monophosphomannose synthase [Deltaproteobacteria bacterium]
MKAIIMIPTYNEAQNIAPLVESIFSLKLESQDNLEIVIVDDHSPDGTSDHIRTLQKKYPQNLHLVERLHEKGRGTAGIAGFLFCLERDVDCIFEMDADFSHDPVHIPTFLGLIKHYDLVIGSRYVQDGEEVNRTWKRALISFLANSIYRLFLGLRIRDLSSGYKCYRKDLMKKLNFKDFYSHGYPIGMETVFRCHRLGAKIIELPVSFHDRRFGKSKFSFREITESLKVSFKLSLSKS